MTDILHHLDTLRRPRLLICAARIGAEDYRRDIHLKRILGHGPAPRIALALARLMEIEAGMDVARLEGDAGYSSMRHVEVMIAVIGEARLLRATRPVLVPPVTPAPVVAALV